MCPICGNDRCIGKYLLHPKEMICISRIKMEELKVNCNRDFILVDSPSSGEIFTKFKELHVIAGPDEDLSKPLPEVSVYIGDIIKQYEDMKAQIKDLLYKDILLSKEED